MCLAWKNLFNAISEKIFSLHSNNNQLRETSRKKVNKKGVKELVLNKNSFSESFSASIKGNLIALFLSMNSITTIWHVLCWWMRYTDLTISKKIIYQFETILKYYCGKLNWMISKRYEFLQEMILRGKVFRKHMFFIVL